MANSDIQLLFSVLGGGSLSGESGSLIQSELTQILNELNKNPFKIKVGLDADSTKKSSWTAQLQKKLDALNTGNKLSVTVSNIKIGTNAISSFKQQLGAVINTLNLDKDVAVSFTSKDIGEITTQFKSAGDAAAEAAHKAAEFKVQMEMLGNIKTSVQKSLTALATGNESEEEKARIAELTAQYEQWAVKVEEVRASKQSTSGEYKAALEAEGVAIQDNVNKMHQERQAAADADAAQQAAAKNKQAAEDAAKRAAEEARAAEEKARVAATERNTLYKQISDAIIRIRKAQQDWNAAENGKSSSAYADLEGYIKRLQELQGQFSSLSKTQIRERLTAINREFAGSSSVIKDAGENTKTLTSRIGNLASKFTSWLTVSQVVTRLYRALKQMVSTVIEIDSALTQLKIVTGANDAQMEKFLSNATSMAKELGQTISDVLSSIETFSRLGYNLADSSTLAEFAAILTNVASVDMDEATTGLTSIIKGFNFDVADAEHVADVLIEVGQKYAVSASEMMEAYEKSGAALNATNTSFEKSAGLIAAANASVQNASVVGTALKTISARIRGATSELDELGEDSDELAQGFSKYASELKALTGFSILQEGSEDSYKDLYDIFEGIAQVWDSLSETSQARVAEILGGTRQLQVISSIITNWSDAAGAYESAMNAASTSAQANAEYMDSIQGHIGVFKATFQELSTVAFDSDLIKWIVDAGTHLLGFLTTVSKLADALGGMKTILTATLGALFASKYATIGKMFQSMGASVIRFGKSITGLWPVIINLRSALYLVRQEGYGLREAFLSLGVSIDPVQLSIKAVTAAITIAIAAYSVYRQKVQKQREDAINAADSAKTLGNEVTKLTGEYLNLSEAVKTDGSVKEDLIETQNELIKKLGIEKSKIKELRDEYGNLSDAIKQASVDSLKESERDLRGGSNAYKEQLIEAADEGFFGSDSIMLSGIVSGKSKRDEQKELYKGLKALEDAGLIGSGSYSRYIDDSGNYYSQGFSFFAGLDDDLSTAEGVRNAYEELGKMLDIVSNTIGSNNELYDTIYEKYNSLSDAVGNYKDSISSLNENLANQYMLQGLIGKETPKTQAEFDTYRQSVIDSAVHNGEFVGNYNEVVSAIDSVLSAESVFASFYTSLAGEVMSSTEKIENAFTSVFTEDISEKIEKMENSIKTLSDALSKLEDGTLEVSDVISLLKEFPELSEYVDLTADNFGNLDVGLRKIIKDSPKEVIETLREFEETNSLTEDAANQVDNLCEALESIAVDSLESVSEEFGLVAESIEKAKKSLSDLDKALAEDDYDSGYNSRVKHLEDFKELVESGQVGSKKYAAYTEYYGIDDSSHEGVRQWIEKNEKYLTEGEDGIREFLNTVAELEASGMLDGVAAYSDGVLSYDINQLDAFAKALGWSEEMLQDFLDKYRMYSDDFESRGAADTREELTTEGLIEVNESGTYANLTKLAEYINGTTDDAQELIDAINELNETEGKPKVTAYDDSWLKEFDGWTEDTLFNDDSRAKMYDFFDDLGVSAEDFLNMFWKMKDGDQRAFDKVFAPLLKQIEWSEEEIEAFRKKLFSKPWEIDGIINYTSSLSTDDSIEGLKSKLAKQDIPFRLTLDEDSIIITQRTIDKMFDLGATEEEITTFIQSLASRDDVVFNAGLKIGENSVDEIVEEIQESVGKNSETTISVKLGVEGGEEIIATVTAVSEEVVKILGEGWKAKLDSEDAQEQLNTVGNLLEGLPLDTLVTVSGNTDVVESNLQSVLNFLDEIDKNKKKTIHIVYESSGTPSTGIQENATGTQHARQGLSLLGDEYSPSGKPKPELVVSDGQARIAGLNGPELGYLNDGDVVYPYKETKEILNDTFPAFAGGKAGGSNTLGTGYAPYTPGESSAVSVDISTDDLEETLEKMSDDFQEIIDDIEHSVYLLEKSTEITGIDYQGIIKLYQQLQHKIKQQIDEYYKLGLDANSDYIQDLEKQWWEYNDSIRETNIKIYESSITSMENAISHNQGFLDNAVESLVLYSIEKYVADNISIQKQIQDELHREAEYYRSLGYDENSSEITELGERWNECEDKIKDAQNTITDALSEIVSASSDSVDQIQEVFSVFETAIDEYNQYGTITVDTFQEISDLGLEYMQILQDENGLLSVNKEKLAEITAAKVKQLALENAMAYVERIRLAVQKRSTEEIEKLTSVTVEASDATWGLLKAELEVMNAQGELDDSNFKKALSNINAYEQLAMNAQDSIMSGAEDMAESSDTLIDYVMSMLKQRTQDQIEAIEDMKDAYSEIINLRKEALDEAKEEAEYEDEVADKVKKIAKIQAQINALSLDDSREAISKRTALEEELAGLQKELSDYQNDHAIEAQKDALDKMQEAYEEEKDSEIEKLEDSISSYQKLYEAAIAYIKEKWETGWTSLYEELADWNTEYGSSLNSEIGSAWSNLLLKAQAYGDYLDTLEAKAYFNPYDSSGSSGGSVTNSSDTSSDVIANSGSSTTSSVEDQIHAAIRMMYLNSQNHGAASEDERKKLHESNLKYAEVLRSLGVNAVFGSDGYWYLDKVGGKKLYDVYSAYTKYHSGGIVGDQATLKQNETIAILENGEMVLNAEKEKVLYKIIDFFEYFSEKIGRTIDQNLLTSTLGNVTPIQPFESVDPSRLDVINNHSIQFGDVNIYGASNDTVNKHIEINRQFTNEILSYLNIKR